MTRSHKLHAALLTGALALGMTWAGASTARAQDQDGQQAGAQDQGRRGQGRGQGQGRGGAFARNPAQAVEQYQQQVMALDLSADQKSKLEPIFKEQGEKAKTLATEVESLQGRERAEKMMAFNREMREKVNGVLTEEQRGTLRKNAATRTAKQMTDRYRRATAELGLSDDQKSKVEAILGDAEKKISEAIAQAPEGGAGGGFGGGQGGIRGGPFGEVQRDTREKVAGVLTAEQKTKFEEAMQQRGGGGQGGGRRRGQGGNQQ